MDQEERSSAGAGDPASGNEDLVETDVAFGDEEQEEEVDRPNAEDEYEEIFSAEDSLMESSSAAIKEEGRGGGEDEDEEDEEDDEEDDDDEEDESEEEDDEDDEEEEEEEEGGGGAEEKSCPPTHIKPISLSIKRASPPAILEPLQPKEEENYVPLPKKRGRPSKADIMRRNSLKAAAGSLDETPSSLPKKRGRRPMPKEEKERLKEEKREKRKRERLEKRKSGEGRRKPGRKAILLTKEEKEKREIARKAKYEEFKRLKAEKAAKRAERNEQLKIMRKKRKEEEARQREAYEKRMQELKASFLDETTQMSYSGIQGDYVEGLMDETSQSSISSFKKGFINEISNISRGHDVTAETLFEYRWPLDGKNSEYYFLQEQVCEYLGVKSFKRRYPDVARRKIDFEERDFLVEMRVVNETQADLGLTAIPSSEVLDIMSQDFYEKYDKYMVVVSERKDRSQRQTSYNTVTVEKHRLADFVERAVRSAAEWNKKMNKERTENRRAYFDLQTFNVHYPMNNRGLMKVVNKQKLGHYPISIIPGQFTDYYRTYSSSQLKYLPLNSTLAGPPQAGTRIDNLGSERESDSEESSSCSDSSDEESVSDSDTENEAEEPPKQQDNKIDYEKSGAKCKTCQGDRQKNKIGIPEKLLHCSACDQSAHPTCVGLSLDLLQYVTNYEWECTDCKKCSKCKDHTDEEKMLFCDLCDRGYHIYCVGLEEIPSGRWHCVECSYCNSCGSREPHGGETELQNPKWVLEYKPGPQTRMYSHTLCTPCYKATKKGQFCPECYMVFGREELNENEKDLPLPDFSELSSCWVCARQHHSRCVGQPNFICAACQRKTKDKSVGTGKQTLSASGLRRVSAMASY